MESSALSPSAGGPDDEVQLPDAVFDGLFQRYSMKLRRAGLESFIVAAIMFDVWAMLAPNGQCSGGFEFAGGCLAINILLLIVLRTFRECNSREILFTITPYVAWTVATAQLNFYLIIKGSATSRDLLGWVLLLVFLILVVLPVPYYVVALGLAGCSVASHIITVSMLSKSEHFQREQIEAMVQFYVCAFFIGSAYHVLMEHKHLRSFREAKASLEAKMVIEVQSAEQERLLLSVLPEHVAVQMRQDLGSNDCEQFKKIYMSRHENVSILYADIVGFTAISSTYSAQDLVKMLNELFARFDRLAEKYHQLRIKILGDCYYCISGAPIERPDHAAQCVYMGLSMVKAIKYVQKKTNSPVDMRVGIHTGAILAGILGQRQWQFDVYSRDVELANKMESSGKAGRVHISEKTLGYLNGEFEVEPAYGEKREESLRIAGLKTFFIKKVLVPFTVDPIVSETNGIAKVDTLESMTVDAKSIGSNDDEDSKTSVEIPQPVGQSDEPSKKNEDFRQRLKVELLSRDLHSELSNVTDIWLRFTNHELERGFVIPCVPYFISSQLNFVLIVLCGTCAMDMFMRSNPTNRILSFALIALTVPGLALSTMVHLSHMCPNFLKGLRRVLNKNSCMRNTLVLTLLTVIGFFNFFRMWNCGGDSDAATVSPKNESQMLVSGNYVCLKYPSFFSNYAVVILITTTVLAQFSHIVRVLMMSIITLLHCLANLLRLEPYFIEELYAPQQYESLAWSLSAMLVVMTIALGWVSRHMEKEDRVIYKWRTEVIEQKEKATDMRRRNEKLVYNILPIHVAEHFMCNNERSYDELYSQSYEEVGVLFASMPNFSDFYSEDTVNNQGLECLRFLNEVISDFDALLEVPRFQNIIKIKTISSTYMAASGLNPSRNHRSEDPITVRWEHLSVLVDFALELKKTLQSINEQSFNHFVLKMGINHGPITAGVIGARKPHYDIWGNTVNVASRMESTGKAGAIQVTEETCHILQPFGYTFEQRGLVAVKGKGELMTYYLQGKTIRTTSPAHNSPMLSNINPMETLPECDESRDSQSSDQATTVNPATTPSAHLKSPSQENGKSGVVHQNGDALTNGVAVTICFDEEPAASTPLLVVDLKNSSNSNANEYSSGDSERDALIMSTTSGH